MPRYYTAIDLWFSSEDLTQAKKDLTQIERRIRVLLPQLEPDDRPAEVLVGEPELCGVGG